MLGRDEAYWDEPALRAETQRVLDICHGCRRCWNVCPPFGDLFKRLDQLDDELSAAVGLAPTAAPTGPLEEGEHAAAHDPRLAAAKNPVEALTEADHRALVDDCYQCKLCFNLCPYHPPHRYHLDFPRLIQRAKAVRRRKEGASLFDLVFARADLVGRLAVLAAPLVNALNAWRPFRVLLEKLVGLHRDRALPRFASATFASWWRRRGPKAGGAPAALFYGCTTNYNEPQTGKAAVAVLEKNGARLSCPAERCCGMPFLDAGDLDSARAAAGRAVEALLPHARRGEPIVTLGPSCSLMLRQEAPELLGTPESREVAAAVVDVCEHLVRLKKDGRLSLDFKGGAGKVAYQPPCHLKAQNIGFKSKELLELLPSTSVALVDRCSAHDGTWSMKAENFELSMKAGRKLFDELGASGAESFATDCPLAAVQIRQGTGRAARHPIELVAEAYGVTAD